MMSTLPYQLPYKQYTHADNSLVVTIRGINAWILYLLSTFLTATAH